MQLERARDKFQNERRDKGKGGGEAAIPLVTERCVYVIHFHIFQFILLLQLINDA